jgi:hypothetical protein
VFWFSLQIVSETYPILRRIQRDIIINVHGSSLHIKYLLFLSDIIKLKFCRQIFEKFSDIKFHENMSSGSRVVTCGQIDGRKDRHDEANSRFSQILRTSLRNPTPVGPTAPHTYYPNSKSCFRVTHLHYSATGQEHFVFPSFHCLCSKWSVSMTRCTVSEW